MKKITASAIAMTLAISAGSAMAANLSVQEQMGRHLYQDKDLSWNRTQSCATCHHRSSGFADPTNSRDPENTMVSLGDDGISLGGRNAPTSAYAGYSPILAQNAAGEWIGGMFWDGRMTGEVLGDPLAEQAQGPPLNPVEMNMPDVASVVARVEESQYAQLFIENYGTTFFDDPIAAYDEIARLIAAYERSGELNPFNSRYDRDELTAAEARGLAVFRKAGCDSCHSLTPPAGAPGPVFTTYGYANIGVPNNPLVNPDPDLGLGYVKAGEDGKFKIPTLRNVAETAPYSHNGYFPTLTAMVSFHNDRGGLTPDVEENLVDPVNVALNTQEIADVVAFLGALTDVSTKR
ncbi:MAG: c-type cytochrome [Proteobacteria bacterium]|nr:c-type cytochrome [Pseudomonadota bacterium]MBU1739116.1 c-type cytochrome [Pseudomonadota bacterium]